MTAWHPFPSCTHLFRYLYVFSTFKPLWGGFILKMEHHCSRQDGWGYMGPWRKEGSKKREKREKKRDWQREIEKNVWEAESQIEKVVFKMDASSCSEPQRKREKVTTILLNYTSPSGYRSLCLTIEFSRVGRGFIFRLESVHLTLSSCLTSLRPSFLSFCDKPLISDVIEVGKKTLIV